MKAQIVLACVALLAFGLLSLAEAPVLPQGIIPVPEEPSIVVAIKADQTTYAPGDPLKLTFTLSRDAYVYLYNLTADGKVKLIVPNRFLQDPWFPAGTHTLPTRGWVLRVTEPEGIEYLQLVASAEALPFYQAKAFETDAFLMYVNPAAFAAQITALLPGTWGTAWTFYRVHRPRATLSVITAPSGASVWVGGVYLGRTPLSAVISPGRVRVRVEKEGYEARSLDLSVADGEELTLSLTLAAARPSLWGPVPSPSWAGESPPLGVGLAVGITSLSIAVDFWGERLGLGVSLRPAPPRPDLTQPGPGGWYPWGPEIEGYFAGWLSLGPGGGLLLAGLSVQEMAWIPAWSPGATLAPLLDIEPETRAQVRLTWGIGLGVSGAGWRAYLLWHCRRNIVVGLTLGPW
ncbi:DUF4384 domain-containing protein [Candidatus Bipolaricaulota bacterium]|nr:DUF4384 domain-containing protein [Candidatus Bipolaricaulota bacterium]